MDKILDWIFEDSRREFLVRIALSAGGALLAVYGLLIWVRSRMRHEVLPREFAVESDCRALRIFAAVIFGMEILLFCWSMSGSRYDLSPLFAAIIAWLVFAGSVIAVRSRRWGYVLLLLVEFFLAGALIPACCVTLGV